MTMPEWTTRDGAPSYEQFVSGIASALDQKSMTPTHEQKKVMCALEPAVLVVAGAGSGKTATMSQKIAWHISQGHVTPHQILGLTFTRKAAGELADRVRRYINALHKAGLSDINTGNLEWPTISTYNSFASDIASSYALLVGEDPRARLITEAERWQIMNRIVRQWKPDADAILDFTEANPLVKYKPSSLTDTALSVASGIIDHGINLEELHTFLLKELDTIEQLEKIRESDKTFNKGPYARKATGISAGFNALKDSIMPLCVRLAVLPFVQEYIDYKKENGLIEFADQVRLAASIVTQCPQIGQELRDTYKLVLLDEYQDTSVNQAQLLKAAFKGDPSSNVHVTAVGDPNQAIYGWRGASANALQDFLDDFEVVPDARLTLSTAWRNSRRILECANALTSSARPMEIMQECRSRCSDKVGEEDWPIATIKKALPQWTAQERVGNVMQLSPADTASEGKVIHIHRELASETYPAIAARIQDFMDSHRRSWETDAARKEKTGQSAGRYKPPTMAVLVKYHKYAPAMIEALEQLGIKSEHIGGESLVKAPEIRLIRALLTVAFFPSRNDRLLYLLNFFALGVGDIQTLARIGKNRSSQTHHNDNLNLIETLENLAQKAAYSPEGTSQGGVADNEERDETVADSHSTARLRSQFTKQGWERMIHIASLVAAVRQCAHMGAAAAVQMAIDELNLIPLAHARPEGQGKAKRMLDRFIALAREFDGDLNKAINEGELAIQSFVHWIDAIEQRERGEDDDSSSDGGALLGIALDGQEIVPEEGVVQILTVHSAKGLEWDLVAVPEMVTGEFDAIELGKAKQWQADKSAVPWSLRSDAQHLPNVSVQTIEDVQRAEQDGNVTSQTVAEVCAVNWAYLYGPLGDYYTAENRRLAYVALTRPKTELIIATSSYKNEKEREKSINKVAKKVKKKDSRIEEGRDVSRYRSVFVEDIESHVDRCVIEHDIRSSTSDDTPNAETHADMSHSVDPSYSRDADTAGVLTSPNLNEIEHYLCMNAGEYAENGILVWPFSVDRSLGHTDQTDLLKTLTNKQSSDEYAETTTMHEDCQNRIERWKKEANLLIAQQAYASHDEPEWDHLTASGIVRLHSDPEEYILQRRRPIPTEPLQAASIGTAVHEEIAHFFSRPAAFNVDAFADPDEMPIDMDLNMTSADSSQLLARLKESRFAHLPVIAIEQSIDISLAGYPIRCVLDAVFDTSGIKDAPKVTIVDWKTGRRPSPRQFESRNMQLALYRLAWARAHQEDLSEIGASFYYLAEDNPDKRELHSRPLSQAEVEDFIRTALAKGTTYPQSHN